MNAKERLAIRRHLGLDPEKYDAPISALTSDEMDKREAELQDKAEKMLDVAQREGRDLNSDEAAACDLATQLIRGLQHERQARKDSGDMSPHNFERWTSGESCEAGLGFGMNRKWGDILYRNRTGNTTGFKSFEQFLEHIAFGKHKGESRAMNTIIGESGGFIVPDSWSPSLINMVAEKSIFMDRVRKSRATSQDFLIPMWQSEDRTAGPLGAFAGSWQAEAAPATPETPKVRLVSVPIQKFCVYVDVSREAYQDGLGLAEQIGPAMVEAISYGVDDALINGNGMAKPLGILGSESAVDVTRNTASAIKFQDVAGMISRMWPAWLQDCIWLANPATLPQLLTIQDASGRYLWTPTPDSIVQGIPGYLFGLPVFLTEKAANLGTRGDLMLCAPQTYAFGLRQDIQLETTNAAKWAEDLQSWRITMRAGGTPMLNAAITPKSGGSTLSWAIVLK